MDRLANTAAVLLMAAVFAVQAASPVRAPLVDHHQHLLSPALAAVLLDAKAKLDPVTADRLIEQLDEAGISRALVLSLAYAWGSPSLTRTDEYEQVRRENDWTSQQVGRYPDRLRAFCGLNPLKDYALAEIGRCAKDPYLRYGIKLHFGNSQVDLRKPSDLQRVQEVFREANKRRMAIVVHLWTGRQDSLEKARIFLTEVVSMAPHVPIQIAHLSGAGPGLGPDAQQTLAMFANAVSTGDPRTKNLYFDITTAVTAQTSIADARFIADRIRQIGLKRVLYGSDMAIEGNPTARESWAAFRTKLPLTDSEFNRIASNVAPYMR